MRRVLPLLLALACVSAAPPARPGFRIETLAPGVFAAIRTDPPGLMVDANCVFIVGEHDVLVVDAPEASAELIAALKRITRKPVRTLVNTHWHDDHVIGNATWRTAYPGIEFVAHPSLRTYLPTTGARNRAGMIEGAPGFAAYLQAQAAKGLDLDGKPISDEQRASVASDAALVAHYMRVVPGTPDVLPDTTVDRALTLQRASREVQVLALGRGHTASDLVVWLPRERIAIVGDLVVWPVPLVGGEQSHVHEWSAALEALLALEPRAIVPGHGPVLRDGAYVRQMQSLFDAIDTQVRAGFVPGDSLAAVRRRVDLASQRERFAGTSRVRGTLFDMYVAGPAVESAFRAAVSASPPAPRVPAPAGSASDPSR